MAHEFKPGDLALIVGTHRRRPETIGRCVALIEKRYFGDIMPVCWVWDDSGTLELTDQRHLMPLKGDEQPAQVRRAERVQ